MATDWLSARVLLARTDRWSCFADLWWELGHVVDSMAGECDPDWENEELLDREVEIAEGLRDGYARDAGEEWAA